MMDVKEKLVEIMEDLGCNEEYCKDCEFCNDIDGCVHRRKEIIADRLIASGVTVQEWISVKDRLPEKDGAYLTVINCFGYHSTINIHSFAKDGETVNKYDLAGEKYVWYFYDSEYGYVSTNCVTHWMQLPDPPKGE